jgi:hypothetical protein
MLDSALALQAAIERQIQEIQEPREGVRHTTDQAVAQLIAIRRWEMLNKAVSGVIRQLEDICDE